MKKILCINLFLLVFIVSCTEPKTVKDIEYKFAPIGWSFKLPNSWVAQEGHDIDAVLEKYGSKIGLSEDIINNFDAQKIFMLKTKSSFNRFTSEIVTLSSDTEDFERAAWDYKEQLSNQLMQISPTVKVKSGYIQNVLIDEIEFKTFEVQFNPDSSKNPNSGFFMQVYLGAFEQKTLAISYTCIEGNFECGSTKKHIESSRFKKI